MDNPWWHDDEELLAELGEAMRAAGEVPDRFVQAGKSAFTWRLIDGELAELVTDSAMDAQLVVRTATDEVRVLSFRAETVSVDLQVSEVEGRVSLRGLVAGAVGDVVAQTEQEQRTAGIDEDGWFTFSDFPRRVFRLVFHTPAGAAVTTALVSL